MEKDGKLVFETDNKVSYSISENILFKKLYEVTDKKYRPGIHSSENSLDDIFILKASKAKKDKKDERKDKWYDQLVKDGCYIDGTHYIYGEKSSSMIRTQKTVFIKEEIIKTLQEHLTLGKQPNEAVTSKWITTKGYLLSSVDVVDILPRIVVIPDFKRIVKDDVYIMEEYKPSDEDKDEYEQYLKDKAIEDEDYKRYKEDKEKAKELFKGDYLPKHFNYSKWQISDDIKSTNGWKEVGRRPMTEEVLNPYSYCVYAGKYHPTYKKSQTEKIKLFPVKPYTVGKNKNFYEDYPCEINCFDGEGVGSLDFFHKVQEKLGIKHEINSLQIRLPYIKSNVVRVDWKNWMLEHGIRKVTPINLKGEPVEPKDIRDIDILMTESCFKAKLEKAEGKNPWLFENMEEYYSLLEKYNYTYFGITNYSHEHEDNEINTLSYQVINSTDLNYKDLMALSREEAKMLKKVRHGDTAYVKAFLNIIANKSNKSEFSDEEEYEDDDAIENDEDYKDKAKVFSKAIQLNERYVFDKEVQKFLYQRVKNYYYDMLIGKILVPSQFLVATGDIIAFLEWSAYRDADKVKGFLGKDEFYCEGKNQGYVMTRYPLCHFSEIKVANFVTKKNDENYKWINHLNNIVQFNTYDLTMVRLNEDFDGDKNLLLRADISLAKGRVLKDAIIDDYPIYNPDDKATTNASKFDIDAILKFEKLNQDNKTGEITNLNSSYQTKAHNEGSLLKRNYESSVCKMLQGEQIDSVKKGTTVVINKELKGNAWQKPYFMRFKYGDGKITKQNKNKYMIPMSPLDKFSEELWDFIKDLYPNEGEKEELIIPEGEEIRSYLDIPHIHALMMCDDDSYIELALLNALQPIFNEYSHKKGELYEKGRGINRLSSNEDDKELVKQIKNEYRELYTDTREKAFEAYKELYGDVDIKTLASVCTEIEYVQAKQGLNGFNRNKSYNFPWIVCPEGLIENIKDHEDAHKTLVFNCKEIKDKDKNTINIFGNVYKIIQMVKKIPLKEPEQPKPKKDRALKDYKCSLVYCSGEEAAEKLDGKVATLKLKDGTYFSFYLDGEYIASIAKGGDKNLEQGINLKDFLDTDIKISVDSFTSKSLKVTLQN